MALEEVIHLSAKSGAWFFVVEIGEKGIVLGIEDAAGVHALGEDFGKSGFADADGAFDDDVAGRVECGDVHGARL